jgi:septal ring factor EnvC (AmiA/AmiB activator)
MSFIAITYGYNQYSIFNTNVSTQALIDCVTSICIADISSHLNQRLTSLSKEIEVYGNEEETIKKNLKRLENEISKEEEKQLEIQKALELANKEASKNRGKGANIKKPNANLKQPTDLNNPLHILNDEKKQNELKLCSIVTNKDIMIKKRKLLIETLEKNNSIGIFTFYKKILKN